MKKQVFRLMVAAIMVLLLSTSSFASGNSGTSTAGSIAISIVDMFVKFTSQGVRWCEDLGGFH